MDHAVVQRWLRTVLGPYTDRDRVFADVDRALIAVSSLSPKTEVFTFNDGRTQLLLTLQGTIPVEFRNTTYNIPVAYWIPRNYPHEPPMAFVAPTPNMAIRKGPNVDPSGEIGGEYLTSWTNKPEACNLLDLIHSCQHMFGREPPVYAKPKPTPVYATPASSNQQPRSQPSMPQQTSSSSAPAPRPGPPPLPASPRSPSTTANPSLHSPSFQDTPLKPPPPAPAPTRTSAHSPPAGLPGSQGQSQQPPFNVPHRPPKLSSSLGPDAGFALSPRGSISHTDTYISPAPVSIPARDMHSPQQLASARLDEATQRRSSGSGFDPPSQGHPSAPSSASRWLPQTVHDHPAAAHNQRHQSQQNPQQPYQQSHQQHQRSHTMPYPASEPHPNLANYREAQDGAHIHYNGSPAPIQPHLSGQPSPYQARSSSSGPPPPPPPPIPGPHQYQNTNLAHSVSSANGFHELKPALPSAAAAPRSKSINLLDDEDAPLDARVQASCSADARSESAAAAPPPPRPINPELLALHDRLFHKIDVRLTTLSSTLSSANARLKLLSSDLDRGLPAIEDEMARLKAVSSVCKTTGDRLEASVGEITESIRNLEARAEADPDSMVLATSIVGNQLVELVAEDNAIEDTLYHLGRALNAERIGLDMFLKQTRMLAREQFMKRALANKISHAMGWAP